MRLEMRLVMLRVANLLTEMTLQGAPHDELERVIKHSMAVIDAEKYNRDWKRSEVENGIPQLMEKYQPSAE